MNEVKRPKKPLICYYVIVMTIVVLFNMLAMPALMEDPGRTERLYAAGTEFSGEEFMQILNDGKQG